jgi:hypothetical protein
MLALFCLQATSLRHPFIVPCVESWVVQNHTVNMIYAFCQNGDLSSYLTKIRKQVIRAGYSTGFSCMYLGASALSSMHYRR